MILKITQTIVPTASPARFNTPLILAQTYHNGIKAALRANSITARKGQMPTEHRHHPPRYTAISLRKN